MKKTFMAFAAALTFLCLFFSISTVFAAANVIKIDGTDAQIPNGWGRIREKDDRTFVPIRFVSEYLDNRVWYMDDTKTACIESSEVILLVQDGNRFLTSVSKLDGASITTEMDTAAYIEPTEGRMYLPIRFMAEAIGYTVGWDEVTQTVTIDKK